MKGGAASKEVGNLWIRGLINYRFCHVLATNARRPIKGSKDADFRLVF